MTRVFIVAPSAVVRAGLESILADRASLEVVGSAPALAGLTDRIDLLHPDVVLLDLDRSGERADGDLPLAHLDGPAFVLLAGNPSQTEVGDALRRGARALLPRGAQPEEIMAAIEAAANGLIVLHPESANVLLPLLAEPVRTRSSAGQEVLTPREVEVLGQLAEGAGNKQIARRLGISEHTVKFHVGSILAKLNAGSRTEAVTIGVRQGMIMV